MSEYITKRIQKRLKDNIESGQIPPEQQFALIDSVIDELLGYKLINGKAVEEDDQKRDELINKIIELQKEIAEIYKKRYDNIMKL